MKWFIGMFFIFVWHSTALASAPNWQDETKWENWPTVGKASLSWLFLSLFKSELKTPSGSYEESTDITPHPMALSIVYQRDITKEQLIAATKKQWQKLGYDKKLQEQWVIELESIYISVQQGERLVYITNGVNGEFHFYKNNKQGEILGEITNESLNDAFLSIWLSPSTEYPSHRASLIGSTK